VLLALMSDAVMGVVGQCRQATATCDAKAAFDASGELSMRIACKLFDGKLAKVVPVYNAVHKHMSALSRAAILLEIAPDVTEHEDASQCVAVAVACTARGPRLAAPSDRGQIAG